jgi:hypothetical protein
MVYKSSLVVSCILLCSVLDQCAGYGGALSIHFGMFTGLQHLGVDFFKLLLLENVFAHCSVEVRPSVGGNAYGGGVSVYMGGYSSSYQRHGTASAHVGGTSVHNISLTLRTAQFTACSAIRSIGAFGGNSYGGSFSFYVGAYAWSKSDAVGSSSIAGATIVSELKIDISDSPCDNCSAVTTGGNQFAGANSYGGSMSVAHIGGYAWSYSNDARSSTSSRCEATTSSGLSVSIRDAACSNCRAVTISEGHSDGANSYGGSLSVAFIGGYAWSYSVGASSNTSSRCEATTSSGLSVSIRDAACSNCRAVTSTKILFNGANSYGGSMSVAHIGGYAWSYSNDSSSSTSSRCEATTSSGLSASIRDAACSNCSALTTSGGRSDGANSYGGSMSVAFIGGYAWSDSVGARSSTSSRCEATTSSGLSVSIRDAACSNCSAVTSCGTFFNGANSFGGSMSVVHIGGHAWSFSNALISNTSSRCEATTSSGMSVSIRDAACSNCRSVTISGTFSDAANSYGGSMSVVYIGGYAWSDSFGVSSNTSSRCEATNSSGLNVSIRNAACSICSAVTNSSGGRAFGANSYGGSMSVAFIGGYAWGFSTGDFERFSSAFCQPTHVDELSVSISQLVIQQSDATSRKCSFELCTVHDYG